MSDVLKPFLLAGKTTLVTGAGSGLGASFCDYLTGAGSKLILAARRMDKLEETRKKVEAAGGEALCVSMDVTSAQSVEDAFSEMAQHGWAADIVINNAGISREQFMAEMSEPLWDAVVDTNLKGAFLVAQQAARAMMAAGNGGSIVNIASILGHSPSKTLGPYCAAKAGLLRLTETMALEWARFGIRVNAISPGFYRTEINDAFMDTEQAERLRLAIPQKRMGNHDDLAGALLLLASDAGRYMTGSNITVDGGLLLNGL